MLNLKLLLHKLTRYNSMIEIFLYTVLLFVISLLICKIPGFEFPGAILVIIASILIVLWFIIYIST